ncbi:MULTISPECIES: hypothetical protein [Brevibacillus]|jgi:hypothetical protein|uniref:hypothetical protein n=1 Tax=Brevibacillus TaxID=55080 RepID=UPI001BA27157|nr:MULTISPECIES: hypothetical protein [Bacillales]MBR8658359.1 hypothetical protein [Brevibacillus sp. NL20B1]MDT3415575.1 hypothetical protein [Brevibacillus aydinogluensis]UFJ60637.1 hypothetical protein IRT44_15390 [Anoxybacillus sediminis]
MGQKIGDWFRTARMVQPEKKTESGPVNADEGLAERPVVDEIDYDENCFRIYDATQYDYAISVTWFREISAGRGVFETAWGSVKQIDADERRFLLVSDWDSVWIQIEDVVRVTKSYTG